MYVILNEVRKLSSIVTGYHDNSVVLVLHVTMYLIVETSYNGKVARMHHMNVCILCVCLQVS